ncbi:UNC-like C-terminal-domain-containing protein [Pilobolus umbonatus]|nr:UNC-like C-terminal-domain-containing protein [Pilobolus umbonatus]
MLHLFNVCNAYFLQNKNKSGTNMTGFNYREEKLDCSLINLKIQLLPSPLFTFTINATFYMLAVQSLIITLLFIHNVLGHTIQYTSHCAVQPANKLFLNTCPILIRDDKCIKTGIFPTSVVTTSNIVSTDNNYPTSTPQNTQPDETTETTQIPLSNIHKSNEEFNLHLLDEKTMTENIPAITLKSVTTNKIAEPTISKPLVSFQEWRKKASSVENEKDRRHKMKSGSKPGSSGNKRQMVDSIDGGFSDDFGSMFEDLIGGVRKEQEPNVYEENEYISPKESKNAYSDSTTKMKQQFAEVRSKSLKERFNYASIDCAATVRKANKEAKGAHTILLESKDQYLLNKCAADKFVIINLCEQIVVDTIVMANFEFFSSTFKDFKVYASSKYPTNDWKLLGQWQARNTRDLQIFKVPDSGFVEYLKIEFLTHYGNEYYCPLSLVRVHGMSMMEYYTVVESQDDNPVLENEHLWSAEVREQIIQPQHVINNISETFPIKVDVEDEDEGEVKLVISPIHEIANQEQMVSTNDMARQLRDLYEEYNNSEDSISLILNEGGTEDISTDSLLDHPTHGELNTLLNDLHLQHTSEPVDPLISAVDGPPKQDIYPVHNYPKLTIGVQDNVIDDSKSTDNPIMGTTSSSVDDRNSPSISKPFIPISHPKEGSTQESIYKTIMKRLNVLEVNVTLSQRYLDDQNKMLNDVFLEMERRHQAQLILLIGHLNETASHKIDML